MAYQMKSSPAKLGAGLRLGKFLVKYGKKIITKTPKKVVKKTKKINPAKTPDGKTYARFTEEISNNPELSKTYSEEFIKTQNKYLKTKK